MTDAEILAKVKAGLSVGGTYNDTQLQIKTIAVKEDMLGAGISQTILETDLGIACLTIGVSDIWNLTSGDVKFSTAYDRLVFKLQMMSSLEEDA